MATIDIGNVPAASWLGRKKKNVNHMSTEATDSRMVHRKKLTIRSRRVNDMMSIIALLGIVLTIIATELRFHGELSSATSILVLRSCVTGSTAILIGLLFYYHALTVRAETINARVYDWQIVITKSRILLAMCEVFVCVIHPYPYYRNTSAIDAMTPDEILLTLPMFARLYLVARSVTLHSTLVNASASRTIGSLNQIPMTMSFVIRAILQIHPVKAWSCVIITLLLVASWSMRVCEEGGLLPIAGQAASNTSSFSNSMWLIIVTFTTVGYGDYSPQTYCGRCVSATTGLCGVFASAVLIAVLAGKIGCNRSELNVLEFIARLDLARAYKTKKKEIVYHSFRAWFLKRRGHHRRAMIGPLRQLYKTLQELQTIKQEQRFSTNDNEYLVAAMSGVNHEQKTNDRLLIRLLRRIERIEEKTDSLRQEFASYVESQHVAIMRL